MTAIKMSSIVCIRLFGPFVLKTKHKIIASVPVVTFLQIQLHSSRIFTKILNCKNRFCKNRE